MMKNRKYIAKNRREATWLTFLLWVCSFFIACTQEDISYPGTGSGNEGEDVTVFLSINTPQPTLPTAFTSTRNASETQISEVKILVFEKNNTEYLYKYCVTGSNLTGSGQGSTQFKASLVSSNANTKLVVLTNSNDAFEASSPPKDISESETRRILNKEFYSTGLTGNIPMYGEILLPNGLQSSETYNRSVTVLRSIARIDVIKDLQVSNQEFILEELYAFRANDKIKLVPESIGDISSPKVTTPSLPENVSHLNNPIKIQAPGGIEEFTGLYLPESAKAETHQEKVNGATTLVVGGRYGGENSPLTYYRIDFNSGLSQHPFGQILRNYRYIFKIKSVTTEGWETPEDAANNVSSSITVDIQTWEDFSSEMYLGENRLGLSHREISMRYVKERFKTIDVESTLPYKIQWLDENEEPIGASASEVNSSISNENFEVTIVKKPGDTQYISHLVFRTLNNNYQGDIITNKLRITADRWTIDIVVKQDNVEMYSHRYFNVLSTAEVGDLGTPIPSEASGQAMRRLMDKQFVPDGTVKIGGFSYTRIPNNELYMNATAEISLVPMKKLIGGQNVIYLPNNVQVSETIADILIEWLEADAHRILMVGTDSQSTNMRLRNRLTDDGIWYNSNVGTYTTNFNRAPATTETDDFFEGPFGSVSSNTSFNRADDTAGYNYSNPVNVTPLIVSDKLNYSHYMFFGVNKNKRIIYHGDAQLFQQPQMSNINGNVNTDLDRLMANTWAWIVEQLIYGNN